jgi:hypothetical protein
MARSETIGPFFVPAREGVGSARAIFPWHDPARPAFRTARAFEMGSLSA